MGYTKKDRLANPLPTQAQVALGAVEELLGDEEGAFTSRAMAEVLTEAQAYLPPQDRITRPVSLHTAAQYLGFLRERGLVRYIRPGRSGQGGLWSRAADGGAQHA